MGTRGKFIWTIFYCKGQFLEFVAHDCSLIFDWLQGCASLQSLERLNDTFKEGLTEWKIGILFEVKSSAEEDELASELLQRESYESLLTKEAFFEMIEFEEAF